ncbi:MAG: TRAP transporter large permease subunit, partial [Gammaproteobacteria bacterium]|nr:TRAP transporter large permease subunit [Gammaproteobacteria bacterium]
IRTYRIDNTLQGVMMETAKTTSMVFIILIGAAMLTSAFRAFGGEELVKEHLTSLPGGFWTQFIVVMIVIFFLGFFLDFLEIAVVVVPIVAPILLADPSANVTAVWFGVMVGLNIQTSFLTPPFGFALFYLRGVAPSSVRTLQIYKGASAFIALQILGLIIAGAFPSLVNYLPNKTHLTSDTAPPPSNPKLQECMENYIFVDYDNRRREIEASIDRVKTANIAYLPESYQDELNESFRKAGKTFSLVEEIRNSSASVEEYSIDYSPLHIEVRQIQRQARRVDKDIETLDEERQNLRFAATVDEDEIARLEAMITGLEQEKSELLSQVPDNWESARDKFKSLAKKATRARQNYRMNVDESYETIITLRKMLSETSQLVDSSEKILPLIETVKNQTAKTAMEIVKSVESEIGDLTEVDKVKSFLSKARRALRGNNPEPEKAIEFIYKAAEQADVEIAWHKRAAAELSEDLEIYDNTIADTIGMRMQTRLTHDQAESISECLSVHKDLSLYF